MNAAAQSILSAPTYEQLLEENDFLQRQINELAEDKTQLEHLIRLLRRLRFAPKTEVQGKGQGTLFNEAETFTADDSNDVAEDADDDAKGKDEPKPKLENRGKPVRKSLPKDLPTIDTGRRPARVGEGLPRHRGGAQENWRRDH